MASRKRAQIQKPIKQNNNNGDDLDDAEKINYDPKIYNSNDEQKKITIEFPEDDDMLFLLSNLFIHDPCHDFNPAIERLEKSIMEIESIINFEKELKQQKGGIKTDDMEIEENNTEEDIINKSDIDEYQWFEKGDKGDQILNFIHLIENRQIPDIENISFLNKNADRLVLFLNNGKITSSKISIIQSLIDFVDYTKFYLLGYVNIPDSDSVGKKHSRNNSSRSSSNNKTHKKRKQTHNNSKKLGGEKRGREESKDDIFTGFFKLFRTSKPHTTPKSANRLIQRITKRKRSSSKHESDNNKRIFITPTKNVYKTHHTISPSDKEPIQMNKTFEKSDLELDADAEVEMDVNVSEPVANEIAIEKEPNTEININQAWSSAINIAIHDYTDPKMINYFKFMNELYSSIEIDSFNTLNNKYVDQALVIFLLCQTRDSTLHTNSDDAFKLLDLLIKLKPKYGGVTKEAIQDFKDVFDQLFKNDVFGIINEISNNVKINFENYPSESIKPLYNAFTNFMKDNENIINSIVVNKNEFNNSRKKLDRDYNTFKGYNFEKSKKTRIFNNKKKDIIFNIKGIQNDLNTQIEGKLKIIELTNKPGKLNDTHENVINNILKTIATGGIYHIFNKNDINERLNTKNTLLSKEYDIIQKTILKKFVKDDDKKLRIAFTEYAKSKNNKNGKITYDDLDKIKNIVNIKRKENNNFQLINNAARKDFLEYVNIKNEDHICPISSRLDAMGTLGTCISKLINGTEFTKRENNTLAFNIYGPDHSNGYYLGEYIRKKKNPNELSIIFYSGINDFYVRGQIDIKIPNDNSKKITKLSAENTYNHFINHILNIWENKKRNGDKFTNETMWEIFTNNYYFSKMIATKIENGISTKGIGDFYQEINSVAENGGYIESNAVKSNDFRIGVMHDQPSGVRAGYLLLNAKKGIHKNSFAGYFGENPIMILR